MDHFLHYACLNIHVGTCRKVSYVFGGGKKFVGHCHSVMHEYETIQIFKFYGGIIRGGGGNSRAPAP